MKEIVLITGANGNLAQDVGRHLEKDYIIRYLTTDKNSISKKSYFFWDLEKNYIDNNALKDCKHIVHLAGHSILKRWTKKNKQKIYDSRIKAAELIFIKCKNMNINIKTFISASATGIYDYRIQDRIIESSNKGNDWVSKMACDWENSAEIFSELGARVVKLRIPLIFSKNSGFLKYNLISMKYGLGIIIGNRQRNISWMHINDISRFVKESISNDNYNGPYNLASDDVISQERLFNLIREKLFPYSIVIRIPTFFIRLLLGKRTQIINSDIFLETKKLKEHGFKCKFNSFEELMRIIKTDS